MKRWVPIAASLLALSACGERADNTAADSTTTAPAAADDAGKLESTDDFKARAADFGPRDQMPGAALYAQHCAGCHDGTVAKAPHLHWLEMMSPRAIVASLTDGIMSQQGAALSAGERRQIAEFVTLKPADDDALSAAGEPAACEGDAAAFDLSRPVPAVGWGHDTARYSPAGVAGLTRLEIPELKLKWAFAFPGALRARSQPTIAMGAVFVGSHAGRVYAFDLATGCARWTFDATAEVRTGIVVTPPTADGRVYAVFGDILARLYAVDALSGELVWSLRADEHPSATLTGTPALAGDHVFVPVSSLEVIAAADPAYECCTFRGKVMKVEVASGAIVWQHYTIPSPPAEVGRTRVGTRVLAPSGAPTWTSPAVDRERNRIYIGTGENYSSPPDDNSDAILAIDMTTGERVWQRQSTAGDAWNVACMMADNPNCPPEDGPDFDHGSSMILVDLPGGDSVLTVGHKDGTIFGLDPDEGGALLWATRVGRGSIQGGVHFGMAVGGTTVYAPINDMNDTYDGSPLDPDKARPGVHAIDAATGEVLWSHVQPDVCPDTLQYCDPGVSAPVTATPDAVFAGHLDGFLRAFDAQDGDVLWEFDTKQPVQGINGPTATGGSMSGSGAAIVDGHVVVNSGYGLYFHEPGNMLAVFSVNGE